MQPFLKCNQSDYKVSLSFPQQKRIAALLKRAQLKEAAFFSYLLPSDSDFFRIFVGYRFK
jgi:hypothetical protein